MHRPYTVFIGIDWGRSEHYVCAVDLTGNVLHERKVAHDTLELGQLADWAAALAPPGQVAAAIELPHGAIIDCLLEREIPVFSINPKQVDRFRERYSPAGPKDDRRDAFVLADSLRNRHATEVIHGVAELPIFETTNPMFPDTDAAHPHLSALPAGDRYRRDA